MPRIAASSARHGSGLKPYFREMRRRGEDAALCFGKADDARKALKEEGREVLQRRAARARRMQAQGIGHMGNDAGSLQSRSRHCRSRVLLPALPSHAPLTGTCGYGCTVRLLACARCERACLFGLQPKPLGSGVGAASLPSLPSEG